MKRVLSGTLVAVSALGFTYSHAWAQTQSVDCKGADPYEHYECLDDYLGTGIVERMLNYYKLEWGHGTAPADPNAPSAARPGWPATPATVPPLAYTEFPTGATTSIGVTRPNVADSPLMVGIANTSLGHFMADNNLQFYGWVNPGFNISSNSNRFGNAPVAYTVDPNTIQLDQFVMYLERVPDTVQTDHFDWGFRISGLYGQNYRYTNSYGIASYQFNKENAYYGYDFPMMYAELYFPKVLEGMLVRIGRYISIPDIEAQLAPNNIMYTHSLTYAWDNYTNTGVVASIQATKNWLIQIGITDGTETPLWHYNETLPNPYPNPLYPGATFKKDPGNQPSGTFCIRWESDTGNDVFYPCLDGINKGQWGYNNIQWHGFTYYHKFNDHWHIDYENYWLQEYKVPNLRNQTALNIFNSGGTPFSPQYVPFNSPNLAYCKSAFVLDCTTNTLGVVTYINYTPDSLNNWSLRPEWYYDPNGWRTGTGAFTQYYEITLGWQHWLSPQIELRPEISYWRSLSTAAFNGNVYEGIPGNRNTMTEVAMDAIIHF